MGLLKKEIIYHTLSISNSKILIWCRNAEEVTHTYTNINMLVHKNTKFMMLLMECFHFVRHEQHDSEHDGF